MFAKQLAYLDECCKKTEIFCFPDESLTHRWAFPPGVNRPESEADETCILCREYGELCLHLPLRVCSFRQKGAVGCPPIACGKDANVTTLTPEMRGASPPRPRWLKWYAAMVIASLKLSARIGHRRPSSASSRPRSAR